VPVVIVQSEHDEFIKREHAEYLARSIPNAEFALLNGVTHFAPLQRPRGFNATVLEFVAKVLPREGGRRRCFRPSPGRFGSLGFEKQLLLLEGS
jgi:hypothetical protein